MIRKCLRFSRWMVLPCLVFALKAGAAQQPGDGAASQSAPEAGHVVMTVDDQKLTVADVEKILATLPPQTRDYYSGAGRHLLPQYLVRLKLLSEQARREKLGEQPEIRSAIEIATESILADAARKLIESSIEVSEEQLTQLYEARRKEFEEVHLRRILIRTEASILSQSSAPVRPPMTSLDARMKLEKLREQVQQGADFAELARLHSDDEASAPFGGDLGFVNYRTVIPPILQAADRLEPGQVSQIIPTAFGMELIQVVEKRTQPLEAVRAQLEVQLRQGRLEEKMQELQGQHKVSMDEAFFAPQEGRPAPAGTMPGPGR